VSGVKSYRQARAFHRVVRWTASTRPMARIYGVIQQPLDQLVYRSSRGRTTATAWLAGMKVTMLTTTGARTGLPRTVPVLGLPDGPETIVIASNYGRPHHPAWYHNLKADPHATIVVDGVSSEVVAHELQGSERDRDYHRAEEMFPGFTRYGRWASHRTIPVLRLRPR
jgi:deazaflavin-dependent oxidoreductase (nitroreductase family)